MCSIQADDDGRAGTAVATASGQCRWCGRYHGAFCPLVKALEFHPDGTVKRVEFHAPQPIVSAGGDLSYDPRGVGSFSREYTWRDIPR
jgi:hypothetical protein